MTHRYNNGRLTPLKDRLTTNRRRSLMEKREYRRLISQEHAKTRGIASMAFANTLKLRQYGQYGTYVLAVYAVLWVALVIYLFAY